MRISDWSSDVCSSDLLTELPSTGTHNRYLGFLEAVVEAQASLVARWMLIGFVHGGMNTDNTTISGETIDYGPCAFLDAFDPAAVFSSIDHGGRYAFGNQPAVLKWNLVRLAETLLPLIDSAPDNAISAASAVRSNERRVGKECDSTWRSRWSPDH